jgi:hypothetical protein
LRGHAVLECVRHEFSVKGRVSDRGAMALNITYDYAYRASVKLVVSCHMFVRARRIRVLTRRMCLPIVWNLIVGRRD